MRAEIFRDLSAFTRLRSEWERLWRESPNRPVTLQPAWAEAWWRSLGGRGELHIVVVRDDAGLCGVLPLYLAPPQGGRLRVRQLRLLGDGVIGERRAALTREAERPAVLGALCRALAEENQWDVLELELEDGEEATQIAYHFGARGWTVETREIRGAAQTPLGGLGPPEAFERWLDSLPFLREGAGDARLEVDGDPAPALRWLLDQAGRETGRRSEPAFTEFVGVVAPTLLEARAAELLRLETPAGPVAALLLLCDGPRWAELVRVAAPGVSAGPLVREALRRAVLSSAERFEFCDEKQPLATTRATGVRVQVFHGSAQEGAGGLGRRGYASLVYGRLHAHVQRLRGSAPEVVQRVVAQMATFSRLHLYRGELFVRGGRPPLDVTLRFFSESDFDALDDRGAFLRRLGLDEAYCREKWTRGDAVVLAEQAERPTGILWCARSPVYVPDIGREVRPRSGECYIHDVYVPPEARGRALAPAMLDFLAKELRGRDVYRAWALIERSNTASTRAFEKAAYASVADVIYARMGRASKLLVRPPDPEARAFLGLPKRNR